MNARFRLLLVEDSAEDAELVVDGLRRAGLEVDCNRVETEDEYLAAIGTRPDLIICDYKLPRFDGLRALHVLRDRGWDIPFILTSGTVGEDLAVEFMRLGAADYLLKDRLARLPTAVVQALTAKRLRDEARLATEELRESEARYASLVDVLPQCLYRIDHEGRLLFANAALLEELGRPIDECLGRAVYDLYLPDRAEKYRADDARVLRGESLSMVEGHVDPVSGARRFVETLKTPVRNHKGAIVGIQGIFWDVTARALQEEALRLTQFAVDHAPDQVVWTGPDGRFVYVNDAACRLLGYSRDELLGMAVWDVDADLPAEQWPALFAGLRERGSLKVETRQLTRDGRMIPAELTANYLRFGDREYNCASIRDITDRKAAEAALRESEERLRRILEHMPTALDAVDGEGRIALWNRESQRISGYSAEEIVGNPAAWELLYPDPDYRARMFEEWKQRGGQYRDWEWELTCKDGTVRTVAWSSVSDEAPIAGWSSWSTGVDVTDRKVLQEQLLQSQKVESIGRLAGGVAHDFNNLLTAILGYTELAAASLPDADPAAALLAEVKKAGTRAAGLTSQLLAFARKQMVVPRRLDLNAVVADAGKMLRRLLGEDVEIVTSLAPDLGAVEMDPGQIHQVLLNLAVNARDAMPHGGRLIIETANAAVDASPIHLQDGVTPGEYVMVAVSDTGAGMSREVLAHVFEPFFTTKPVGRGTGLGLATCHGIVRQAGGHITVFSEPDHGTTFRIYLPRFAPESEGPDVVEAAPPLCGGRELIILAEDESAVRSLATLSLRAHGYRVAEATDGREALDLARQLASSVALLVTDIVMPAMSGMELAERFKQVCPNAAVVLMSGHADTGIVPDGAIDPGIRFLPKPFTPERLARMVRVALDDRASGRGR